MGIFEVIAEPCGKSGAPHPPPRLYSGPVIINANVRIPTFPLLPVQSALALLEPRILEKLKCGEDERQCACTVFVARCIPIFCYHRKSAQRLWVLRLRSKQID